MVRPICIRPASVPGLLSRFVDDCERAEHGPALQRFQSWMKAPRRGPAQRRGSGGIRRPGSQTVLVQSEVELLSPANKTPSADRDAYLGKRGEILAGPTQLVEIDLSRGGTRPHPPKLPPCDYYALASRYEDRPSLGFWPIALRERLPVVQVPLAAPDSGARLDLQAVLDRVYDAAGFGAYI